LSRPHNCPTRIFSASPFDAAIADLVGGRRWILITSNGWIKRGAIDRLVAAVGKPVTTIDSVPANPRVSDIERLSFGLPAAEVAVALGGGSVIDAAKGIVAVQALNGDLAPLLDHLKNGVELSDSFAPIPIIAVPTTSGTGSEVTRWGTIWGDENVKFSLHNPTLYPSDAVIDPTLCTSMPADVTLSSGLDALSHAMEAIWNQNNTPLSDQFARTAIAMLRADLEQVMATPEDVESRRRVQIAALFAGYAMGTTQTALAHSISYPFTANFDMPHGFACSFTLPEVARYNLVERPERLSTIAEGMGCSIDEIPAILDQWFDTLGIGPYISRYVSPEVTEQFGDNLITRARAANNLREVDGSTARTIARKSLERFCNS
jgi:phosphonate metabolism-associated iron-containing alcohol dehydrogenase